MKREVPYLESKMPVSHGSDIGIQLHQAVSTPGQVLHTKNSIPLDIYSQMLPGSDKLTSSFDTFRTGY